MNGGWQIDQFINFIKLVNIQKKYWTWIANSQINLKQSIKNGKWTFLTPTFAAPNSSGCLRYLTKGRPYRFRVAAETVVGTGPYTSVFQQAPSWMDWKPPQKCHRFFCRDKFRTCKFRAENGCMDGWWWVRTSLGVADGNMTWDGVGMLVNPLDFHEKRGRID